MRNEGTSSSRGRRDADEWRPENDRYDQSPPKDTYRRGSRDDYGHRDTDSYGRDFPSSNVQHSDSYEDERKRLPYNSWQDGSGRTPGWEESDRDLSWSRWTPKDNTRAARRNDKSRSDHDNHDRFKDSSKKVESKEFRPQERRRDNGWASRRRNTNEMSANSIPLGGVPEQPGSDDKPSEPSGTWQPTTGRNENQRKSKHNKKKNKNKNEKRNNRDWRNDDGHLNK